MGKIHGIIECMFLDAGSKSEGVKAVLTDDEGKKFILYRANILPQADTFFLPYDGMSVTVDGSEEPQSGTILVNSIIPDNNQNTIQDEKE